MNAIWCASVKSDPGFSITKMVTRRIRSEYMKKFKDPKWETYSKCYEEMLKYRLTRRLLEHTHNPWFWSGSDTDSDSGRSPPSKNLVQAETELEECVGGRLDKTTETLTVPRIALQNGEDDDVPSQQSANIASQLQCARDTRVAHREDIQEKDTGGPQKDKRSKSSKQTLRSQRVRPAPSRPPREDSKGSRHPFALYGSGEKEADIAGRRTHNVGPAASTDEIHGSALRAKTRREVERHFQNQRAQCRRAKSADLAKARNVVQPEFNPWLTEYMRCFSARSR